MFLSTAAPAIKGMKQIVVLLASETYTNLAEVLNEYDKLKKCFALAGRRLS